MATPGPVKKARLSDGSVCNHASPAAPTPATSTRQQATPAEGAQQEPQKKAGAKPGVQPRELKEYYAKLFPTQDVCKWLAYGNDGKHPQADATYFPRREFSFTLDGNIFVRHESFQDARALQAALDGGRRGTVAKMDLGAVYNVVPSRRQAYKDGGGGGGAGGFHPVERELVFDIDLTDYDAVRTCCRGGAICARCWPLMTVAIQVLDRALRDDFGFEHVLWVYSGRRGVHAWVCDERARVLTDEARAGVANYLSLYHGEERDKARLALSQVSSKNHPAVARAHGLLLRAWKEEILPGQELLGTEARCEAVLAALGDGDVAARLRDRWRAEGDVPRGGADLSVQRWGDLEDEVAKVQGARADTKTDRARRAALGRAVLEVVFSHAYPRLDVEVTKKRNHLLKAPFCVHPATGKVCVPIDPACAEEFDPDGVPTVQQLTEQLRVQREAAASDAGDGMEVDGGGQEGAPDRGAPPEKRERPPPPDRQAALEATALGPALATFRRCFLDGLAAASRAALGAKARAAGARAPATVW